MTARGLLESPGIVRDFLSLNRNCFILHQLREVIGSVPPAEREYED